MLKDIYSLSKFYTLSRVYQVKKMDILIRTMEKVDIEPIYSSLVVTGNNRSLSLYEKYYEEQRNGQRVVLLAFFNGE